MKTLLTLAGLLCLSAAHAAEAPTLRDFAWRQTLETDGRPLQELALPDAVYANALDPALGDLRVFNRDGGVVPHALCPAPPALEPEPLLETLTPFALQAGVTPVAGEGGRIEVRTADGASVVVNGAAPRGAGPEGPVAYILDLRGREEPLRAIRLDWQSADQASEATISLHSSEDLSHWMTLMPSATLLHAQAGGRSLQRARIPLPERPYRFLRIEAGARGPLPRIGSAVAERVTAPELAPPAWFETRALPPDKNESETAFWFDAGRRAPVHSAEVRLPATNMALGVRLQSRSDPAQPWRTRWQGEVFAIASESAQRNQTVVQFEPSHDRYWRLAVERGAETLRGSVPTLLLGYQPARLRFLAQGEGPFQLAYGSARVPLQAAVGCDALLANLGAEERSKQTGQAQALVMPVRGNLEVLKPLPKPTPLRQILLWAVLIAGALLVAAMALSLLRKLRQE
ncbi:MAG TPA: DUF3999 domain-containing protein [Nevskiales bacterium]|nr:DUF3999 domain-containing protein [Nevskiales bacterium]